MAAGPLLVSEPLQRYRALGLAGDPVWRAAGQLRTAVAARLSRRHADLLAIPEVDPTGQHIDWYAPFDGAAQRLADLDPAARAATLDEVQRLHAEISGLADTMAAPERSAAERNFARLLRHALTAPGEDTLYVVDGKPVMTFWGFTAEASLPGAFLAAPPAAAAPAPRVAPVAPRPEAVLASAPAVATAVGPARSTWWQWLLLAALLLALLAFLAWLVRPYLPRLEPWLEAEARERALSLAVRQPAEIQKARVDTLQQENEALRMELARLTDEAARRGADCAAAVLVPGVGGVVAGGAPIERGALPDGSGPGAGAAPGLKGPDDRKVDKADMKNGPDGGRDGARDAGKDGARNDPKNEPKPMVVPPESKQKQDLSFLKGDWRSRTGLATATGERDLRPNYTLDDKGKGKVTFVQQNGATCEAPAEARWDGQKLVIEEKANPRCSDGKTYARNTVNCEVGADGVAKCSGSQPGDSRSYNVQFGR